MNTSIEQLQNRIGIRWYNPSLLIEALTHSSYANENPSTSPNERLEFLGDSIIGCIISERLYNDYPKLTEGELTLRRSQLVCSSTLASIAQSMKLGEALLLGKGEEKCAGRQKESNLSGALEALVASIMLDKGWNKARSFVLSIFESAYAKTQQEAVLDFKSQLLQLAQEQFNLQPTYSSTDSGKIDHPSRFTAVVSIGDVSISTGSGHSKKQAETLAAMNALAKLAIDSKQTT